MQDKITLSFNKISIGSELLEKMNNKLFPDIIDYNDMIILELLFDFVE